MPTATFKRPSGMFGLTIVLIGQAISILASSMIGFALSIWVFPADQKRHLARHHAECFCPALPADHPLAGVMVDATTESHA